MKEGKSESTMPNELHLLSTTLKMFHFLQQKTTFMKSFTWSYLDRQNTTNKYLRNDNKIDTLLHLNIMVMYD